MKRCILTEISCVLCVIWLSSLLLRCCRGSEKPRERSWDELQRMVVLLPDGSMAEVSLRELLHGTLAAEMPAAFPAEALRAQAVAARSYLLRAKEHPRHGEASVCCSGGCCQAFADDAALRGKWGADYDTNAARIDAAVADTDGMLLCYADEPILACFHASSPGATESSECVWREALPYLRSVSSPETAGTVEEFVTVREIYPEDFRAAIHRKYPAAMLDMAAGEWVKGLGRDASGRVAQALVGGVTVPGTALRELFALRSTAFELEWTGVVFRFTVAGSGHGVGLSQEGARLMAEAGMSWREILGHYYPGTELREMGA